MNAGIPKMRQKAGNPRFFCFSKILRFNSSLRIMVLFWVLVTKEQVT
jgi:hypothetical protein